MLALVPLLVFILIFLGSGIFFHVSGIDFAFYQISAPVAILPAIILAVILSRQRLEKTIDSFLRGIGDTNIMAMCMIYLLAGAFSYVAKETGGVDATVNFALDIIPSALILPGIFMVGAFISTAMGTSMGTIAAVAPIAYGIAQQTGIPLPLMAGTVLGGAMFGDNLSIISDTTIAATRTQGCSMKDKFRMNVFIALPAALITILYLFLAKSGLSAEVPVTDYNFFLVIPYILILVMAVSGINVFVTLLSGIVFAGISGFFTVDNYHLLEFSKQIYGGFTSMQEIFLLSMLIGGLSALMKKEGGLDFVSSKIQAMIGVFSKKGKSTKASELGIGLMALLTNFCTANNTVSIIVTGSVARDIAANNDIEPKRSAGILDMFSCICQGLIPYGAQVLLAASIFKISPVFITGNVFYCMALAVCAVAAILLRKNESTQMRHAVSEG
ncbi:Na+/H+ antiporter NhaC family protein [Desulfobotulus sp. H1]|uniref:Na+/H+ antiporter NhaC family protein n=1 Tax=Desulfobotulus pelophilus TaxID=2823377 RepID=A0ABT3N7P0_9BACT|nr:Na+/H+ antiporter NhaC family protein [Desulfobotulus pelophilus]MCW7753468.1 Na+/H+ antiporter NhaC family protein [Desulfobotulus pelophilus]